MIDQDRNKKEKKTALIQRQLLLRCERRGSQVLSSQPPETARDTERVNSADHSSPLCACVDFPNRETESGVHVVYTET